MYQGTISGAFKNALDWLHALGSREPPFLHDQVIGLISAAGGTQGLQAINTMEFAVRALRGWAVPYVVPVASALPRLRLRKAGSTDEASSCSCGRWEPRWCASPPALQTTARRSARGRARSRPSA